MTSHLRNWHRWQKAGIAATVRARVGRAEQALAKVKNPKTQGHVTFPGPVDSPYSMTYICVATGLERDVCSLAAAGLGRNSDTYLFRLLQYVGMNDPMRGELHVPRAMFGPRVLSTSWDSVGSKRGCLAWDAFHSDDVRILVHGPAQVPDWLADAFRTYERTRSEFVRAASGIWNPELPTASSPESPQPPGERGGDGKASPPEPEPGGNGHVTQAVLDQDREEAARAAADDDIDLARRRCNSWAVPAAANPSHPYRDIAKSIIRAFDDPATPPEEWLGQWEDILKADGVTAKRVARAVRKEPT